MSSTYPTTLDAFATTHADGASEVIHAATINDLADGVNKIEAELGTLPKGAHANVKARLDASDVRPGPAYVTCGPRQDEAVGVANTAYLTALHGIGAFPFAVTKFLYYIAVQSGNIDLGVYYSDDLSTFTRLFSTGSFACPTAGKTTTSFSVQTITPVTGRHWFFALAANNATASFSRTNVHHIPAYSKVTSFALPSSLASMTAAGATAQPTGALLA